MYLPKGQSVQKFTYQNTEISFDFTEDVNFMINASEMSNGFNKKPNDFLRLKQTKEYINALKKQVGDSRLVKTNHGGNNRGTWMHRKLAIRFAQWLSPEFAIWVDDIIESILLGNRTSHDSIDIDQRFLAKELLINDLEVAGILGLSEMKAKMTVVRQVATITGVDYDYLLNAHVREYMATIKKEKPEFLSPTDLAPEFKCRSAQEMNKFLERMGLQTFDRTKNEWIPTNNGQKACKREKWLNGSDHHLVWNPSKVLEFADLTVMY